MLDVILKAALKHHPEHLNRVFYYRNIDISIIAFSKPNDTVTNYVT
jgi:hypothetical protein